MALKHFIFDLDGTVIDTEEAILKTWKKTLEENGHSFTMEQVKVVLGVTNHVGLERLGIPFNELEEKEFVKKWIGNYTEFAKEANYFPGVKELLLTLKKQGCSVGAVSSRNRREYADFFSTFDFEEILDEVVLEEDTKLHKPNPDPLNEYMKRVGANPEECIYIGDMPTDMECANCAGVISALVTWNHSGVACKEAKVIFSSVEEVLMLLGEE